MKSFTYNDYIRCIHTLRLNAIFKLMEEGEKYKLNSNNKNEQRKIKEILNSKKEMVEFINEFLNPRQKVKYENLVKYDNTRISRKYKVDKEKLIYKLKDKETYFLVEEIKIFDNIILYEILNYCISIMQDWSIKSKIKKEGNYPIIIPIIIYTGTKEINVKKKQKDKRIEDYIFENYNIDLDYHFININKLSTKYIKQKNTGLTNAILMQKFKNKKDRIS